MNIKLNEAQSIAFAQSLKRVESDILRKGILGPEQQKEIAELYNQFTTDAQKCSYTEEIEISDEFEHTFLPRIFKEAFSKKSSRSIAKSLGHLYYSIYNDFDDDFLNNYSEMRN